METQQDLRYYWRILAARKWYFILPAVGIMLAAAVVALVWPPVYEAKSTILIEEQQIPPEFVRTTVTGFAEQRIQSLSQQILSRARLVEIIRQFDLYAELRRKAPMEEVVERMRKDIAVETISAEMSEGKRRRRPGQKDEGITIAFSVAYRGENPDQVLKVASTLASLYLQENLKIREQQAKTTTQFLEAELKEIQERIRTLGDRISDFKAKNEGVLPELYQFNLSQADRLEKEIDQLTAQIRAAEDRKIYLEGQLATVKPDSPIISGTGERVMDPHARLKYLQVALADLTSRYSPEHPDVVKVKREMAELEKVVGSSGTPPALKRQKLTQLEAELAQKQGRYAADHPEIVKLKKEIAELRKLPEAAGPPPVQPENPSYISLQANLQATVNDIAALKKQRADLEGKLKVYRQRLERTPQVEQEYLALTRDYQNAHAKHQEIMNKILEARIAEGMEESQKAERFTLIDPAVFPEKPVAPNRLLILLAGVLLGTMGGLGLVALTENLDHTIKSASEVAWLSGLPVLARISRIVTAEDRERQARRRRLAWTAAGLSLVAGLLVFHFLIMDLWILTAKLGRVLNRLT
ncbi:MAG: GNVR domain-containing protein [Desulfobaccales bacterium]